MGPEYPAINPAKHHQEQLTIFGQNSEAGHQLTQALLTLQTDSKPFVCTCGKKYETWFRYRVHVSICTHGSQGYVGPNFRCRCKREFINKQQWRDHLWTCTSHKAAADTLFECSRDYCFYVTDSSVAMDDHVKFHDKWEDSGNLECESLLTHCVVGNFVENDPDVKRDALDSDNLAIGKQLEPAEIFALKALLREYMDLFPSEEHPIGIARVEPLRIDTGNAKPIWQPARRLPQREREIVSKEIQRLLDQGIIEPSRSPWQSPVVLVPKNTDPPTWRMCGDYRRLNTAVVEPKFCMPLISDILDSMKGGRYFTTIDLVQGYNQIPIHEDSRDKLSIITEAGTYRYKVLPFGVNLASSVFQQTMNTLFGDMLNRDVSIYVDDLAISSATFEEHLGKLRRVLQRLRETNFTVNVKKSKFAMSSAKILGFIVNEGGISQDPAKVEAVRNYPKPMTVTEIRSFIGLCSFYRMFIEHFAKIADPLTKLYAGPKVKKTTRLKWTPEADKAFEDLKEKMCSAPVLVFFDENAAEYAMHVDASNNSCGGVLLQKSKSTDKYFHPVAYCSRKFSKSEQNLSTTEREALGILYCAERWRKYILGRRVVLYTDHISLTFINNLKTQNAKLQRWSIRLSEYQFIYIHRSGAKHKDADALSRNAVGEAPPENAEPAEFPMLILVAELDLQTLDLVSEQLADDFCKPIIEFLSTASQDTPERIQRLAQMFTIDNGILYHVSNDAWGYEVQRLVLPKVMWTQVCETVHDHRTGLAHLGYSKCLEVILRRFYWKGMARTIRQYVGSCHVCQTRNPGRSEKYGLMQQIHVTPRVWYSVVCDTVGPMPRSTNGHTYILTCVDEFSGFLVAKTTSSHTSLTFAKFLLEIALQYGFFKIMRSDLGTEFTGQVTQHLLKMMDVKHLKNTAWRPTTTGVVERRHRTLGAQLAKLAAEDQSDWAKHVPYAVFAMNASQNETTKVSPYKMLYGVECHFAFDSAFPIDHSEPFLAETEQHLRDVRSYAQFNLEESRRYNLAYNNPKRKVSPFKVGEQVLLFSPSLKKGSTAKLHHYWSGPYDIIQQTGPNNYRISYNRPGNHDGTVVNVARMKHYVKRTEVDKGEAETSDFDDPNFVEVRVMESGEEDEVPPNDRPINKSTPDTTAETAKPRLMTWEEDAAGYLNDTDSEEPQTSKRSFLTSTRIPILKSTLPTTVKPRPQSQKAQPTTPISAMKFEYMPSDPRLRSHPTKRIRSPEKIRLEKTKKPEWTKPIEQIARSRSTSLESQPSSSRRNDDIQQESPTSPSPSDQGNPVSSTQEVIIQKKSAPSKKKKAPRILAGIDPQQIIEKDNGAEDNSQSTEGTELRRGTRKRTQRVLNTMHHLPTWLTLALCLLCVPPTFAIQAEVCNCKNQKFLGLLDLAAYTTCEKLAPEPKPRAANYGIYAMKKDSQHFIGTTCKATLQQMETYKSFWGATDTIPSTSPIDLSDSDCKRMAQTLSCNGNLMTRLPNTETYTFNQPPSREYAWMTTTKNSVWNCLVDTHTILTQTGPKEPIISFIGELGKDRNIGYAIKNHLTVIWNSIDQDPKNKECEYQMVANGTGTMYKMENNKLRLRDASKQVEFILQEKPEKTNCTALMDMHHVVKGFSDVLINFTYSTEESAQTDPSSNRYKRQMNGKKPRPSTRPKWIEPKSSYELRLEAERQVAREHRGDQVDKEKTRQQLHQSGLKNAHHEHELELAERANLTIPHKVMPPLIDYTTSEPAQVILREQQQPAVPAPPVKPQANNEQESTKQEALQTSVGLTTPGYNPISTLKMPDPTEQQIEYDRMIAQHHLQEEWNRREDERLLLEWQNNQRQQLLKEATFRNAVVQQREEKQPEERRGKLEQTVINKEQGLPLQQYNTVPPNAFQFKGAEKHYKPRMEMNKLKETIVGTPNQDIGDTFPYAASGDLRQEFLISHLQYLRDNQIQIANILNGEVHNLDCQSRTNKAALISIMAKQSGVRAAKLVGLNDCHSITAHGTSQALLYQCQKVRTTIEARKTKCGMEPYVLNSSLSLDGYTVINPFIPCLHGGLYTTIGDQIFEWKDEDWSPAKQTITLSHDHLAAMFKIEVDSTAMQSLANWHEPSDRSYFDLLGELSAVMENSGSPSLADTMNNARQNHDQINTVAVGAAGVVGAIEQFFSPLKWVYTALFIILPLAFVLWVFIKCCGWKAIKSCCCPKKRRIVQPQDNPIYNPRPGATIVSTRSEQQARWFNNWFSRARRSPPNTIPRVAYNPGTERIQMGEYSPLHQNESNPTAPPTHDEHGLPNVPDESRRQPKATTRKKQNNESSPTVDENVARTWVIESQTSGKKKGGGRPVSPLSSTTMFMMCTFALLTQTSACASFKPTQAYVRPLSPDIPLLSIPGYREYCTLYHQDIATTNTWITALYDVYAPIFHIQGQAKSFRSNKEIVSFFCDGNVAKVEIPELLPYLLLAKLPDALDTFDFSSSSFKDYKKFFFSNTEFNFTHHYEKVLQHARPSLLVRNGMKLIKAMALMTYMVPCLIMTPVQTQVPDWQNLCAEFFTAFDMPPELLELP